MLTCRPINNVDSFVKYYWSGDTPKLLQKLSIEAGQNTVTIIGAGAAGFALAVDLKNHGVSVLVYSHSNHLRHANEVISKGQLTARGKVQGVAIPWITADMAEAVAFSKIIILTVPSTGHHTVLHELRKFSLHQHTVIAVPGNLFSLIADIQIGCVLETNLSPYSCRMEGEQLIVMGKKHLISIAALQQDLDPMVQSTVQNLFSVQLKWCSSVIEVCLLNVNGVFHPLMMLMNAGRIESTAGNFFLYRDGLTRSVANAMRALDQVRIEIGEAFGLQMKSALEVSNECYGHSFTDLVELAQNSGPHNKLKAPSDLENRNISEDVPHLLVCWHSLAEKLGIDASPIKAVIILVEMATGVNYFEAGRDLRQLHLDKVSRDELIRKFSPSQRT
ncbi:6-phosphogluconate dehydrogenase C-terminal domain-like protein [Periconia macrospinosa]|uniref:6-phosphogluconate dehydrogenase C-terminal domain-like protein n=1 Tax=Periconia macrospinosa TaxID=97972 RepID=A0A2V1DTG2_9PLEO|nr:6-phosphogluconate dehydrogenase C-terminal domain-like protein [Periconia macrospinosa]